jgi:hypothetical protein
VQDGKELKAIRKHEGVRDYLHRLLTGPQPGVKSLQPTVAVDELTILHGDDMGVSFGSSMDHYVLSDGTEFSLPTRWSATVVKHEGKWKIANLHVSTNLFDNPVLDATRKRSYLDMALAGGVGLIAGIVVMSWFGKKQKQKP